jgi:hypothetical protein
MREFSRRQVLGGAGLTLASALAGCGSPDSADETTPTPTPSPTPTPTPAIPEDAPAFWGWLPTPAALEMDPYAFASLDLPALREDGLDRRHLTGKQYTPDALNDSLAATADLLTMSTADAAAGYLVGEYEPEAVGTALEEAEYEPVDVDGWYRKDGRRVAIADERIGWADAPSAPDARLETLLDRVDGEGQGYPETAPKLVVAMSELIGWPAQFARRAPETDTEGFENAVFHATGIGVRGGSAAWRTVVSFEGDATTAAREFFQEQFENKQGFRNVVTQTRDDLVILDADTSTRIAAGTQPL